MEIIKADELIIEINKLKESVKNSRKILIDNENQLILDIKSKTEEITKLEALLDEQEEEFNKLQMLIGNKDRLISELNQKIAEQEKFINGSKELVQTNALLKNKLKQLEIELKNRTSDFEQLLSQLKDKDSQLNKLKSTFKLISDLFEVDSQDFFTELEKFIPFYKSFKKSGVIEKDTKDYPVSQPFKIISGRENLINTINMILRNAKYRIILVMPGIEDLELLDFSNLNANIIFLSTYLDKNDQKHLQWVSELDKKYKVNVRFYEKRDRWGILADGETLFVADAKQGHNLIGYLITEINLVNLLSKLVNDVWVNSIKI
ncbi:MAG: hypothetical protein ACTSYZ_14920 [Candidatus Helarchaeota archaeon]